VAYDGAEKFSSVGGTFTESQCTDCANNEGPRADSCKELITKPREIWIDGAPCRVRIPRPPRTVAKTFNDIIRPVNME
jgi:hypothetical protein